MSEQKQSTFIPEEYSRLAETISNNIKTHKAYDFASFKQDIQTFIKDTDILYFDPQPLHQVLSENKTINSFIGKFIGKHKEDDLFAVIIDISHEKPLPFDIRLHNHDFEAVCSFVEKFYRTTQRQLKLKTEQAILKEFISWLKPSDKRYHQKLSSILNEAINRQQLRDKTLTLEEKLKKSAPQRGPQSNKAKLPRNQLPPTIGNTTAPTTENGTSKKLKASASRRRRQPDEVKFSSDQSTPTQSPTLITPPITSNITTPESQTLRERIVPHQHITPPTYRSSFWSLIKNPQSPGGKLALKASFGLLITDLIITGVGAGLYGVSKNGGRLLNNFISNHSAELKLSAEIIPPILLVISLLVVFLMVPAEKNHLSAAQNQSKEQQPPPSNR